MKQSKIGLIINVVLLALSAILTLGVKFVFHACRSMDDTVPCCTGAENAVMGIGICMLVFCVALLLCKSAQARMALSFSMLVCALYAVAVPDHLISLCMMADMQCRLVMYPAVTVLGVLIALVAAAGIFANKKDAV